MVNLFKSRKQKQEEREKLIESILQDMIEDGEVVKDDEGNYGLTDYGRCLAEQKMRMGPIEKRLDLLRMTRMYMQKYKKEDEKK